MEEEYTLNLTKYGYPLKNNEDADYLINMFQQQLDQYKQKNEQSEHIFSKLKVNPDSVSFSTREILEKFTKLQDETAVDKLEATDLGMAILEQATAKFKYQSKANILKDQVEDLSQLTNTVEKDTANAEREIISVKNQIDNVLHNSPNELEKLRLQIKSYEDKLLHYINTYPWIDGPQVNLLSLHEEMKKLSELQDRAEKLKSELEFYEGLSPDLFTAKNQLSKIKSKYEEICKMIAEKGVM